MHIDIIAKQRDTYETLSRDMRTLSQLCELARQSRRDYCAIQQLWQANPCLQGWQAVNKKPDWLTRCASIRQFAQTEAEEKCAIQRQLQQLQNTRPETHPDPLTIHEQWLAVWRKHQSSIQNDPAFEPYRADIQRAKKQIDQWESIRHTIQQQDGVGLLRLWHEPVHRPLYKHRLQAASLTRQAENLIQQVLSQPASLGRLDANIGHLHLTLSWDWPSDGAMQEVTIDLREGDAASHTYTWSKQQFDQHQGKATLPLKMPRRHNSGTPLHVEIYPHVTFLGKQIRAGQPAYRCNLADPPRFLYQWLPDRNQPTAIILHSNRDYPCCRIQLMGNDYRPPLPTDPDNIELQKWHLQDVIRANQSVKLDIAQDTHLSRYLQLWVYADAAGTQPVMLEESIVKYPFQHSRAGGNPRECDKD